MEAFFVTLALASLLVVAGVVLSVSLYVRGALRPSHLRRIRRIRTFTPTPGGTEVQETVEEIIDEDAPVREEF